MNLTLEQHDIIEKIKNPETKLIKVDAVAGSGKTTLLVEISKVVNPQKGLYIAFNKAIATEASTKFNRQMQCMTTHSLAYQNTIKPYKLSVGFFNAKDIKEYIDYDIKSLMLVLLNDFCLSKYDNFDQFQSDHHDEHPNYQLEWYEIARKYFGKMAKGDIPITHAGYLKFYHILLAHQKIKHKEFDIIMLDEAGDLNEVTLEIFKLLPAKQKLMVGDKQQNIYTFNNTINGFERMENEGIQMHMTQSFRCSEPIAEAIENFCQKHIDPTISFIGTPTPRKENATKAIISRNNSTLIGEMIMLNKNNIKYNLTRKATVIFELILILLNLKPGGIIYSGEWRHLQSDVDDWAKSPTLRDQFRTPLGYLASIYNQEPGISSALNIIQAFEPGEIYTAYKNAKAHELEKGHDITLSTAHSMKGLEYSTVKICTDMNESVQKVIDASGSKCENYSPKEIETMRLYYVAASRAINKIENCEHL